MEDIGKSLDRILERTGGILKLKPNHVPRYYRDGGRLLAGKNIEVSASNRQCPWLPERWFASTVLACNPERSPSEGLSFLDIPGSQVSLKEALSVRGEQILGPGLASHFGPEFPVLSKVFDPYDPIMFHFHARDEDVRKFPEHFAPNRNGKEEAYYFVRSPKGRMPYTHVGLHPGVTKQELCRAIEEGADHTLDLSPAFAQRFEEGFHVPAGVPHRPGTALTIEIQQPSDVFTHLDWFSEGRKLSPEQTHPGFESIEKALDFIDWARAQDPHILEKYRLVPEPVAHAQQPGQGEEAWIFPRRKSSKFSGKRVRVTGTFEMFETMPYVLFVWQGHGELDATPVKAGDEFFVTFPQAQQPHLLRRIGTEVLEAFKFFPPEI